MKSHKLCRGILDFPGLFVILTSAFQEVGLRTKVGAGLAHVQMSGRDQSLGCIIYISSMVLTLGDAEAGGWQLGAQEGDLVI